MPLILDRHRWIPANRRIHARGQALHVFSRQLEIKNLRILHDPRIRRRLGQGEISLETSAVTLNNHQA